MSNDIESKDDDVIHQSRKYDSITRASDNTKPLDYTSSNSNGTHQKKRITTLKKIPQLQQGTTEQRSKKESISKMFMAWFSTLTDNDAAESLAIENTPSIIYFVIKTFL